MRSQQAYDILRQRKVKQIQKVNRLKKETVKDLDVVDETDQQALETLSKEKEQQKLDEKQKRQIRKSLEKEKQKLKQQQSTPEITRLAIQRLRKQLEIDLFLGYLQKESAETPSTLDDAYAFAMLGSAYIEELLDNNAITLDYVQDNVYKMDMLEELVRNDPMVETEDYEYE